jgi:hypothetical protein
MMRRNMRRLKVFERDFESTVEKMTNDPEIYPSPTRWYCSRCPYNDLCKVYLYGGNIEPVVEANYRPREASELEVIP